MVCDKQSVVPISDSYMCADMLTFYDELIEHDEIDPFSTSCCYM